MTRFSIARLVGLVSLYLMAALSAAYAQDAGPQADIPPLAAEAPTPAILAQAMVPAAAPKVAPKRAAHDPLAPPVFQPGDQCSYVKYNWGIEASRFMDEVSSVTSREVVLRRTGRKSNGNLWHMYPRLSPTGGLISYQDYEADRIVEYAYAPTREYFNYPLTPGKVWKLEVKIPYFASGVRAGVRTEILRAEFLGVREVKVPAGTFQAIGVRLSGPWEVILNNGDRASGSIVEEHWYSTEVACTVKRTWREDRNLGMANHYKTWELLGFRRQDSSPQ